VERSPYDRYTVWVRGKDGFPHEASFESDETCALAITSRVDRLSYHGAVPKTFPPMTRDLEHPYLLGGLAAFFLGLRSPRDPCRTLPFRLPYCVASGTRPSLLGRCLPGEGAYERPIRAFKNRRDI
jgi:hypothetical protein